MRFLWDFYTNNDATCTDQPNGRDMLDLYAQIRLNGGLTSTNYFTQTKNAVDDIGLPTCLATSRFDEYAAHNGVDN